MTREEKIKLLEAIHSGELSPEVLLPPQLYLFVERSTRPGVYEMDGQEYSPAEFETFKKKARPVDVVWLEKRTYDAINV